MAEMFENQYNNVYPFQIFLGNQESAFFTIQDIFHTIYYLKLCTRLSAASRCILASVEQDQPRFTFNT